MATDLSTWLQRRLGIEVVGKGMDGCCVQSILDWRPQMLGQNRECKYCSARLNAVHAADVVVRQYTGGLNEHKMEHEDPPLSVGSLFFSAKKFASVEKVRDWLDSHDLGKHADAAVQHDMHAFVVPMEAIAPETARAVWIAPGVIGQIGIAQKDVVGGGQASMSSPGITTTAMASGGMVHPAQGPAAVVTRVPKGVPSVIKGNTEASDGHAHGYHLAPYVAEDGFRVKGFSDYVNGHSHMIEAAVTDDGAVDARTAPDQAIVGGHAHQHRVVFSTDGKTEKAAMIVSYPPDANEQPDGKGAQVIGEEAMNVFRGQLDAAIKRAMGVPAGAK